MTPTGFEPVNPKEKGLSLPHLTALPQCLDDIDGIRTHEPEGMVLETTAFDRSATMS